MFEQCQQEAFIVTYVFALFSVEPFSDSYSLYCHFGGLVFVLFPPLLQPSTDSNPIDDLEHATNQIAQLESRLTHSAQRISRMKEELAREQRAINKPYEGELGEQVSL